MIKPPAANSENRLDYLIIGADGFIGESLHSKLKAVGQTGLGTSRRIGTDALCLDLSNLTDLSLLPAAKTVYMCAAINGFAACLDDPVRASKINLEATLAVALNTFRQNGHFIFLSSTAVFGERSDLPSEFDTPSPNSLYGALKYATETCLIELQKKYGGRCSIVRLPKVMSGNQPLLNNWQQRSMQGLTIEAFSNVAIAPISLDYVVNALFLIAGLNKTDLYHLAGELQMTYYELALHLARKNFIDQNLVKATTQDQNIWICNSLAIPNTELMARVKPQRTTDFIADIIK